MTDELGAAILQELRAIRAAVERRASDPLTAANGSLLKAIAAAVGTLAFTVREIQAHAEVNADLRVAINGRSSKSLGRLLRRIEGREVGGLVVERSGVDDNGVIWIVKPRKAMLAIA